LGCGKMAATSDKPSERFRFCCGIDIGVKNLAISFVEYVPDGKQKKLISSYKGNMDQMHRFAEGMETQSVPIPKTRGSSHHDAYIKIFEMIPEFRDTISTVIEMQLAANKSDMSRLDGIAYGFLRGRFPSMEVHLNASTIRKKFTLEGISQSGVNPDEIIVRRGYPESKTLSFQFAGCVYPDHYKLLLESPEADKLDDLCDSLVYASIALSKYTIAEMLASRGTKKR